MNNKFNDGYEYVKQIFSDISDDIHDADAPIPEIKLSKYSSISTYITDVFESALDPQLIEDFGIPYSELIDRLIQLAFDK